jgi:hypothetical protein
MSEAISGAFRATGKTAPHVAALMRVTMAAPRASPARSGDKENTMAFRPNFRQQRSDRDRAARSRQDEKLRKLHERSAKRKADREGTATPAMDAPATDGKPEE